MQKSSKILNSLTLNYLMGVKIDDGIAGGKIS
jgi:hypothetical protein